MFKDGKNQSMPGVQEYKGSGSTLQILKINNKNENTKTEDECGLKKP
jgi:hypothetical protein